MMKRKITLEALKRLIREETAITGNAGIRLNCNHNDILDAFDIERYSGNGYGEDGYVAFSDIGGREQFDKFQAEDAIFTTSDGWRIIVPGTGVGWTMYNPKDESTDYQEDADGNEIDDGNDPYIIELDTPSGSYKQGQILNTIADACNSNEMWDAFDICKQNGYNLANWDGWEEYINDYTYEESIKDAIRFIKKLRERWGDNVIPDDYRYWEI